MKIAYLDCFSGISGDMTLGAFLDAGLDEAYLRKELKKLGLKNYTLKVSKVRRGAISATKFDCIAPSDIHTHRPLKEILRIIDKSALSARVKKTAKDIFINIGKAEAVVHGFRDIDDVEFHELGQVDSIIDIVGSAIAVDALGIEEVYASKVTMGRSFASTGHGKIPVPSPASIELLKNVPIKISEVDAELVTPTGAGILKTLCKGFGDMPQMKVSDTGYGAGTKEFKEFPNILRVLIGEKVTVFQSDSIFVIETNIDDMSPQNFEYIFEELFKAGALDVYITNILMKKSRPAFKLTVLAEKKDLDKISSVIFSETTSIGLRYYETGRMKLERRIEKVRTKNGDVRVKLSGRPGNILIASPEYEDCARIARLKNVPLKKVYETAKLEAVKRWE